MAGKSGPGSSVEVNGIYLHGWASASVRVAFSPQFAIVLDGNLFYVSEKVPGTSWPGFLCTRLLDSPLLCKTSSLLPPVCVGPGRCLGGRGGRFPFEPSALRVRKLYAGKDIFGDGIALQMNCCHAEYKRKQTLGITSQVLVVI